VIAMNPSIESRVGIVPINMRWSMCQKEVRPDGHKTPSDPRKPYAETDIEPRFYEAFGHHDAHPAWNSFGLIAGTLRAL
jgi:hypothetical protein